MHNLHVLGLKKSKSGLLWTAYIGYVCVHV